MTETVEDGTDFGLASRLTFLIGGKSTRNFANQVGVKDSTLRSVLKGTRPSIDFVVAVSKATGASLDWLATGQGRPYADSSRSSSRNFSRELYDMIALCVERVFRDAGLQLPPAVVAATIIDCYDEVMEIAVDGNLDEFRALMPWIEYGVRKEAKHHSEKSGISSETEQTS